MLSAALVVRPELAEAHNDLGVAWRAWAGWRRRSPHSIALDLAPDLADAQNNLGIALIHSRELDGAQKCFEAAIGVNPNAAEAHLGLGLVMASVGRFDAALSSLDRAVAIRPDLPEPWAVRARALRGLGRLDEALGSAERAIELQPDDARAHCLRGFLLDELHRCDRALISLEHAIRLEGENSEAHQNRGVVLAKIGRYDEAVAAFDQALRLLPDYDEARRNRARALLTMGDFDRTWDELGAGTIDRNSNGRWLSQRRWQGEPLAGRTILLHEEQGLGDAIQFIRYAALVKTRGGRVVLVCRKSLVQLAWTCPGIDVVVPRDEPLPAFDVHAPLMSLMCLFTKSVEAIPSAIPYLKAASARGTIGGSGWLLDAASRWVLPGKEIPNTPGIGIGHSH